ncbi:hypothetical protein V1478_017378 [Vespula squamosa]|uniref:Uncharacterized protein n=1 Tax=Vespula squamosa TaxID=30214 RepID=A0ABD2A072_VESSQ
MVTLEKHLDYFSVVAYYRSLNYSITEVYVLRLCEEKKKNKPHKKGKKNALTYGFARVLL